MDQALDHAGAKARRHELHKAQVAAADAAHGLAPDPGLADLKARATAGPTAVPAPKAGKRARKAGKK
jgi:hypothetical protein